MRMIVLFFTVLLLLSCRQQPKQYPMQYMPDEFLKRSKENNRSLNETQEKIVDQYITSHKQENYYRSNAGYWIKLSDSLRTSRTTAQIGDQIAYSYQVYNLKDSLLYDYETIGRKDETLGKADVFRGLFYALQQVAPGEKADIIFPSSLAYGFYGDNHKIKPAMPIKIELKVYNIKKVPNP